MLPAVALGRKNWCSYVRSSDHFLPLHIHLALNLNGAQATGAMV